MQELTVAAALESEHHDIDRGLSEFSEALADDRWHTEPLRRAATALRRHIYIEEEFLFPALRELGLIAPVVVMLREHGEIWRALDEVEGLAAGGREVGIAQRAYQRLSDLLTEHNQKEEVVLYPAADGVLDGGEQARLSELIATGVLPTGWVCQLADTN